jgi:radical SAM family uncharacterized protein
VSLNRKLKDRITGSVLPGVQMPAQYLGGEVNMVRKEHVGRGLVCLAFPDLYTIGMSHHGLQVLYSLMNNRSDWVCERAFAPWLDMEQSLRRHELPLYSLESFTPLRDFDVLGFTLQHELTATNLLTMLDLSGIPLRGQDRTMNDPLVIAGGPCAQNPEPWAPFIDLFVFGDGEPVLPAVCDSWRELRTQVAAGTEHSEGRAGGDQRRELLLQMARRHPSCYVPRFYEPAYSDGRMVELQGTTPELPEKIEPPLLADLESVPIPTRPIVPFIECVHDRIAIEIMRGCPWHCRFCQSSAIKRPLRFRQVETIVAGALESYRHTGFNEISLLSLSSSDYPDFERLVSRLKEVFLPLGVNLSVPSLRVNDQLRTVAELIGNRRRSSLTLAPEAARDEMRQRIRKQIKNDDLYEGCRVAFQNNYQSVKLYFMCGLPQETSDDLDGILDMTEEISRIGREVKGRNVRITASVANFVPKPHTPFQWNAMQTREYFQAAHEHLWQRNRLRNVQLKRHDVDTSLIEGVISRGDRRVGDAIELAWRRGARMDGWSEQFNGSRWHQAIADCGVSIERVLHQPYSLDDRLPWDHVPIKLSREYLEKEQCRSFVSLQD